MSIQKVVVCGGGVLGSQIAFQSQFCGFETVIWLRSPDSVKRTQPKLDSIYQTYLDALETMDSVKSKENLCRGLASSYEEFEYSEAVARTHDAYEHLRIELDLEKALEGADIVIESMSENLGEKKSFYKKMAPYLGPNTIICTNSSSLLPSKFMEATGHPRRFCALHFANDIYKCNTAEVMMTSKTDPRVFEEVVLFAKQINMVPLRLTKEKEGYLLNSMLIPFLMSGFDLYANEISTPEDIDTAWKVGTGSALGPFEILDIVGMKTVYEIVKKYTKVPGFIAPYNFKAQAKILKAMIDKGHLGKLSGQGFYTYDEKGNKLDA